MELCSLPFQNQFLRSCRIWIACSCSTLGECAPSSSWHRWLMRPNGSSNRPPRSYPNPWLQTKESERCDVLHFSNPFPENDKRFFNNLSTTSFFFRHFFRLDLFTKITYKRTWIFPFWLLRPPGPSMYLKKLEILILWLFFASQTNFLWNSSTN